VCTGDGPLGIYITTTGLEGNTNSGLLLSASPGEVPAIRTMMEGGVCHAHCAVTGRANGTIYWYWPV